MFRRRISLLILFLMAILMFLASGLHGSYFCVSPWNGGEAAPNHSAGGAPPRGR